MLIDDDDDGDPCVVHKSVLISVHNRMLIDRMCGILHEQKVKRSLKLILLNSKI